MTILDYVDYELKTPLTHYQRELLTLIQMNPNGYYAHTIHKMRSHGFLMVQEIIQKYHNKKSMIVQ